MSAKKVAIEAFQQMPEAAILEQISEEVAILAAIYKDEAAANAGCVTAQSEVRHKFASRFFK